MKNLAGDERCDEAILLELHRCRIEAVFGERSNGEVAASITGRLGVFTFRRAWYYWVAEGPVPVEVAREMYADPVGATDIRVNGNCGCPAPEGHQVKWFTGAGRPILDFKNRDELNGFLKAESEDLRSNARDFIEACDFAEDPSAVGCGFVNLYHIDSETGLWLFADTLRKHGLDKPTADEPQPITPKDHP